MMIIIYFFFFIFTINSQISFQNYIIKFNKSYHSQNQINFRSEIFAKNLSVIDQINNNQLSNHQLIVNNFTDWTQEEINKKFKNRLKEFDVKTIQQNFLSRQLTGPTSFSWRKFNKVSQAGQQGTCGSCWTFAVVSIFQACLAIFNNTIIKLSQEYILQCTGPNSDCSGGDIKTALQLALHTGIPKLSSYPYLAINYSTKNIVPHSADPNICRSPSQPQFLATKYGLKRYQNSSVNFIRSKLLLSPIIAHMVIEGTFLQYKSGIYSCKSMYRYTDLNHVVLIVGYDQSGNFLIKNSFGKQWGDQGFGIIDGNNDCGLHLINYQIGDNFDSSNMLMLALILMLFLLMI